MKHMTVNANKDMKQEISSPSRAMMKEKNGLVIDDHGSKSWYLHGKLHREDGPAIESKEGTIRFYINGKLHREDGPAVEWADGSKFWYVHSELHRTDGPAAEYDNTREWFLHDQPLYHPEEFKTIEEWIEKLNTDEEYSLHWINAINNLIEVINNPTHKQIRLNAIRWKI